MQRWGLSSAKPTNFPFQHPICRRGQTIRGYNTPVHKGSDQDLPLDLFSLSISLCVYVVCSSCMPIINKATLRALPRPFTVTAIQTASAAMLLLAFRIAGMVDFPNPTLAKIWGWTGVVLAWVVPIVFNMKAVQLLTVETVMMFRSLTIVIVAIGDRLFLKTKMDARSVISCLMISLGGVVYASNDLNFHYRGYLMGCLYAASMVVNSLYIKYCFNQHHEMNSWEKTFLNNLLSTPAVLAMCGIYENMDSVKHDLGSLSRSGCSLLALSSLMGFGISMSGTKCREYLSATSFDVLGSCTKYMTLALSAVILRARNSVLSMVGICIALTGTVLYSPAGELFYRCVTTNQHPCSRSAHVVGPPAAADKARPCKEAK